MFASLEQDKAVDRVAKNVEDEVIRRLAKECATEAAWEAWRRRNSGKTPRDTIETDPFPRKEALEPVFLHAFRMNGYYVYTRKFREEKLIRQWFLTIPEQKNFIAFAKSHLLRREEFWVGWMTDRGVHAKELPGTEVEPLRRDVKEWKIGIDLRSSDALWKSDKTDGFRLEKGTFVSRPNRAWKQGGSWCIVHGHPSPALGGRGAGSWDPDGELSYAMGNDTRIPFLAAESCNDPGRWILLERVVKYDEATKIGDIELAGWWVTAVNMAERRGYRLFEHVDFA